MEGDASLGAAAQLLTADTWRRFWGRGRSARRFGRACSRRTARRLHWCGYRWIRPRLWVRGDCRSDGRYCVMTSFPGSPRILKGGLVLLDPDRFTVLPNGIIALQYNPDTLSRTLKIKGAEEGGDRSEALRLTGPPVETIKLDAEIDAADQLEVADSNTLKYGI